MLESRATKEKLSMFSDAVRLAAIDGQIAPGEMRFLAMVGRDLGLSQKHVDRVLKDPGGVKFMVPKNDGEKFKHVLRLVNMMVVDGRIEKREMDFCTSIAVKMGLRPSVVSDVVEKFVAHLAGLTKARVIQEVAKKATVRRVLSVDTKAGLDAEIEQFLRERR